MDRPRTLLSGASGYVGSHLLRGRLDAGYPVRATDRDMMARYAFLAGVRRRPLIKVPFSTPKLSSSWVATVTPVEQIQPCVAGQEGEMIVTAPPPGISDDPMGFDEAVRAAL